MESEQSGDKFKMNKKIKVELEEDVTIIDNIALGSQFINYFYQTWINNPLSFITDDVIKPFSKFKFNNCVFEGVSFVEILTSFLGNLQFIDCNFEILDSGSRQMYILVTGTIKNNSIDKRFNQSFMLAYTSDTIKKHSRKWTLMNSLLLLN